MGFYNNILRKIGGNHPDKSNWQTGLVPGVAGGQRKHGKRPSDSNSSREPQKQQTEDSDRLINRLGLGSNPHRQLTRNLSTKTKHSLPQRAANTKTTWTLYRSHREHNSRLKHNRCKLKHNR